MAKSRVSIIVWKTWSTKITPLYAIAYAIVNSIDNLRFDKEDYFHVKRNKKHFYCVPIRYKLTLAKVWRTRNSVETLNMRARVSTSIFHFLKVILDRVSRKMFSIS